MELFWKATAGILLAGFLGLTISRQEKDFSMVLYMLTCCMAAGIALHYLSPVLEMLYELKEISGIQEEALQILLKILGIGLVSQLAGIICSDSGSNALGKSIQILGTAVILYLSIPLFSALMELLQDLLGGFG